MSVLSFFLHVDDSVEDIITLQKFFSSSVGCSPATLFPRFSTKLAFTETIFDTFLLKSSHLLDRSQIGHEVF